MQPADCAESQLVAMQDNKGVGTAMNLLIVEDQQRLALALKAICEDAGHRVDIAVDGQEGLDYATLAEYDAIVLDVMLPKLDGFEVLAALRKKGNDVPVIMLTARSTTADKIHGLDLGADDYLTKPFSPPELLARLRALTRRQGAVILDTISLGNTTLNLETAEVSAFSKGHDASVGQGASAVSNELDASAKNSAAVLGKNAALLNEDASVHLSQREFDVFRLFLGAPGKTFSKLDILERVWGPMSDAEENSVEVYVSFLRKKLTHIGSDLNVLTIRSLGYQIEVGNE